jgi:alpha-D-xyloside xylohydrolase
LLGVDEVEQTFANRSRIRICGSADGSLTLYEDEGESYCYEKVAYATIPIQWKETSETLTIGKRTGEFPGMLKERTFHIVWVTANHGNHGMGIASTGQPDVVVQYKGDAVKISKARKSREK